MKVVQSVLLGALLCVSTIQASSLNEEASEAPAPRILRTMEERAEFIEELWLSFESSDGLSQKQNEQVKKLKLYQFPHAQSLKLLLMKASLNIDISQKEVGFMNSPGAWNEESLVEYSKLEKRIEEASIEIEKPLQSKTKEMAATNDRWSKEEIKELITFEPKWRLFGKNEYRNVPTLYVFCREDRNYPCLMIMKDKEGKVVREKNGQIWSQKKLALSGRGLKYNEVNGNTPQGLFTIDSVMPKADRRFVYGKYRRMKLNFVEASKDEKELLRYIPEELQHLNFWKESVVARDMGRDLFRIHGVGIKNIFRNTTYYPFIPTAGCIASIEGKYDGKRYVDQRELLDQFMIAMGIEPTYENETRVKGLLYVVNIDDTNAPVELGDLF